MPRVPRGRDTFHVERCGIIWARSHLPVRRVLGELPGCDRRQYGQAPRPPACAVVAAAALRNGESPRPAPRERRAPGSAGAGAQVDASRGHGSRPPCSSACGVARPDLVRGSARSPRAVDLRAEPGTVRGVPRGTSAYGDSFTGGGARPTVRSCHLLRRPVVWRRSRPVAMADRRQFELEVVATSRTSPTSGPSSAPRLPRRAVRSR
jgi:hypothetical protein